MRTRVYKTERDWKDAGVTYDDRRAAGTPRHRMVRVSPARSQRTYGGACRVRYSNRTA